MNHLAELKRLHNRYYVLRHGHSQANAQGIIVGDPSNGIHGYGLSDRGRQQLDQSLQRQTDFDRQTLIISSDFKRARESAETAHRVFACIHRIQFDERLRERNFGAFELGEDSAYTDVWRADAADGHAELNGTESAHRVMARTTELILDLERRYSGACLLLVSHGDALQLLLTACARRDASKHRQLQPLQTAEIRSLVLV